MRLEITLKGAEEAEAKLRNLSGNIAFAQSKAINDIAVAVQQHEAMSQIPGKLTVRSRGTPWTTPGTKFGVNIKPFATKAKPIATIGSQADWLRLQEQGGVKTAGGHRIAIPTKFWKSDKAILASARRPRKLLSAARRRKELAGRAFIYEGGKMPAGIYARNVRNSRAVRMLFRLVESAPIKAVLDFYESGKKLIEEKYVAIFQKRLDDAIRDAKLK